MVLESLITKLKFKLAINHNIRQLLFTLLLINQEYKLDLTSKSPRLCSIKTSFLVKCHRHLNGSEILKSRGWKKKIVQLLLVFVTKENK